MRDRDPGVSVQTMPFSGTTAHAHNQASLHATTRGAPFILIIFIIPNTLLGEALSPIK